MNDLKAENYKDGYYHFRRDTELYPSSWCYIVFSRRGPGKTYSFLRMMLADHIPFVYMKRTKEDVELICNPIDGRDLSPFVPINRDFGTDIKAKQIDKGIGGFYHTNSEGECIGKPVGIILAMNAIKGIKGIDLSDIRYFCFDEFIPQIGEITRRGDVEGEMMLSLYMTIARDRLKRGEEDLKLVLFANAEQVSTGVTRVLDVVDDMCQLVASGENYVNVRDICIHHITEDEIPFTPEELNSPMYRALRGTVWGRKAFGGEFASQDFTNICKMPIKKARCMYEVCYRGKYFYIYLQPTTGVFYACTTKQRSIFSYNLDTENGQKLFYRERYNQLREACANDKFKFEKYSYYDLLIVNYKSIFKV